MKKYNSCLLVFFLLIGLFSFQHNSVFAKQTAKNVEIDFLYEKIEEIIDVKGKSEDEIKQIMQKNTNYDCFCQKSKTDGYLYKIRYTIVSTEKELLEAMGAKSELHLKYGQKCLLAAFRAANSKKLQKKAEGIEDRDSLCVRLVDTSNDGNSFGNGYDTSKKDLIPDIRNDFWPCAIYNTITISDVIDKYNKPDIKDIKDLKLFKAIYGKKNLKSTVYHEFAHFLDNISIDPSKYNIDTLWGLDGTHLYNEITNDRIAFLEGWAEYNEMIENRKKAKEYEEATKLLAIESNTQKGHYYSIDPDFCDFSTLLNSEAYNATLLYKLSQKLGKKKISETFKETREDNNRNICTFVKKLIELYPNDTKTICKVVDEVFLNKATEEEFFEMVGKTEATKSYAETRQVIKTKTGEDLLFTNSSQYETEEPEEKVKFISKKHSDYLKEQESNSLDESVDEDQEPEEPERKVKFIVKKHSDYFKDQENNSLDESVDEDKEIEEPEEKVKFIAKKHSDYLKEQESSSLDESVDEDQEIEEPEEKVKFILKKHSDYLKEQESNSQDNPFSIRK